MKCIILRAQHLDFADEKNPERRVVGISINYSVEIDKERGFEHFKAFIPSTSPDYSGLKNQQYPSVFTMNFRSQSKQGALLSVPCDFKFVEVIKVGA